MGSPQSGGISEKENYIGVLDVHVHQARDITNICIYHNQDVFAKLCLTSDPENTLSTQIINGGGKNPVFNQTLSLNVQTVKCSLKCEVWMMSRARNYLEDQLLGFALVPLSDVIAGNRKLEKEFSLSSTDLFHSPAGFVQLSLAYSGSSPDVMITPSLPKSVYDAEVVESLSCEFEKIEFPDPKIVSENHLMVSEYFSTQSPDCLDVTSDSENGSPYGSHPTCVQYLEIQEESESQSREYCPPLQESPKEKTSGTSCIPNEPLCSGDGGKGTPGSEFHKPSVSSEEGPVNSGERTPPRSEFPKPAITIETVTEQEVVQQDIVDMYMKSMQQFTESLAKMTLPLNIDSSSGNSNSDHNSQTTPKSTGSRVFYGSRAFF
ncbi:unnamed protein product [Cuscuta epithymum]|uniref:C2 domain-containing protein n=1 Tax=Cuscuta epithymum TaxID=186058 RepID=A0AAV0C1G9_9ASTE|nr:unnamed protein product [Cuscuta epithymum]